MVRIEKKNIQIIAILSNPNRIPFGIVLGLPWFIVAFAICNFFYINISFPHIPPGAIFLISMMQSRR